MIQVGDLVKHGTFKSGVGIIIAKDGRRYKVKWIDCPYQHKYNTTIETGSELKLMEKK